MKCEKEFKKLDAQADFASKVDPLYYTGQLWLGILCCLLTANWMVVICVNIINFYFVKISSNDLFETGGKGDYLNKVLEYFRTNNQNYASNIVFMCSVLYLLAVTQKGNQTIGFRFASPTFYPMRPNETQLSSFLFNILILNCSSLGVTLFGCSQMSAYTSRSYLYKYMLIFQYSDFMFYITQNLVIGQLMAILCVLTILLNYCKGSYRLRFSDLAKKYGKKEKEGKKTKGKKESLL